MTLTLPLSRLHVTGTGAGRLIARSPPGALPTPAELHADNVSTITPMSAEDSERLFENIMKMIGSAREDLAAAKAVRS